MRLTPPWHADCHACTLHLSSVHTFCMQIVEFHMHHLYAPIRSLVKMQIFECRLVQTPDCCMWTAAGLIVTLHLQLENYMHVGSSASLSLLCPECSHL